MNILKNGWIQKLIIAIIIVLLFNFIYPNYVHASIISNVAETTVSFATLLGDRCNVDITKSSF